MALDSSQRSTLVWSDPQPWEPPPEPVEPPEGWHKPCQGFNDHKWELEVEEGRAVVRCVDPCDGDKIDPASHAKGTPWCLTDWQVEDFSTPDPIPVELTFVDESTPSTPNGPAEFGYWIAVCVPSASTGEASHE